jgi:hypothetical protein
MSERPVRDRHPSNRAHSFLCLEKGVDSVTRTNLFGTLLLIWFMSAMMTLAVFQTPSGRSILREVVTQSVEALRGADWQQDEIERKIEMLLIDVGLLSEILDPIDPEEEG